ncbi:MAG: M15 family metallopeptidase [Gammaproteobacteria bacterium]
MINLKSFWAAVVLLYGCAAFNLCAAALPPGFVYLDSVIPGLCVDLRYAGTDNFVGARIDGYVEPRPIATAQAAAALKEVQTDLQRFGLALKVFDAYRPQRAVEHFVRWAKDLKDTRMQAKYYPDALKQNLFKDGYISSRSGHSRGSTVDLTLIYRDAQSTGQELDMGTRFDFFDLRSWPESPALNAAQRVNRMLLQTVMEKHGFKAYRKEWWHFTLLNEPYPDTYFDFPVE